MGNWWSTAQQQPKVRYEVVLPTSARAWEQLYCGDIDTWDAVAARYGMEKFAYCCGVNSCDREAVCLRYVKATLQSDKQTIIIERYKASSIHVRIASCLGLKTLLSEGFRLNEVAAAEKGGLVLLVVHDSKDYISQVALPLIQVANEHDSSCDKKKETEKPRLLHRLSSKKDLNEGRGDSKKKSSANTETRGTLGRTLSKSGSERRAGKEKAQCLGVIHAPHKDMTIISCQLSPDLSQTAIMFYSYSYSSGTFCYTLHCYSILSLQEESSSESQTRAQSSVQSLREEGASSVLPEKNTPHLLRTTKLSREVQPYFVYDPRYRASRIAVANYECRDSGIAHELVVLSLDCVGEEEDEVRVIKRGKLSLPALFGNSRFNLLYSKDGELIILQKLTDDRFGVTSFCDIYIFNSDDLTLIKYMTASLPGLFHICKVSYEPVFSRCGSYMRILDHRMSNSNSDGGDSDESTVVQIYQLPRSLNLISQCRRVILQQLSASSLVQSLPLPHKLKDYLQFGPIY